MPFKIGLVLVTIVNIADLGLERRKFFWNRKCGVTNPLFDLKTIKYKFIFNY